MNIFTKIRNSIYSPSYYSEVVEKPFFSAFKYLLIFALLFAFVFAVVVTIKSSSIINMLSVEAPKIADYFPQDLTIMIKDGNVSTNVQEPYFIKIPKDWKNQYEADTGSPNIENLLVIDTKNKFDYSLFVSYKTVALLTADSIAYVEDNGKISIMPLSQVGEFVLNRSTVLNFIEKARPFIVWLYPIIFIGAYFIGYIMVVAKMFYLLFGALIVWLVARLKGLKLGYGGAYKIGMYLITGPILITSLLLLISPKIGFPFLFTILLAIMAIINLKKPTPTAA